MCARKSSLRYSTEKGPSRPGPGGQWSNSEMRVNDGDLVICWSSFADDVCCLVQKMLRNW